MSKPSSTFVQPLRIDDCTFEPGDPESLSWKRSRPVCWYENRSCGMSGTSKVCVTGPSRGDRILWYHLDDNELLDGEPRLICGVRGSDLFRSTARALMNITFARAGEDCDFGAEGFRPWQQAILKMCWSDEGSSLAAFLLRWPDDVLETIYTASGDGEFRLCGGDCEKYPEDYRVDLLEVAELINASTDEHFAAAVSAWTKWPTTLEELCEAAPLVPAIRAHVEELRLDRKARADDPTPLSQRSLAWKMMYGHEKKS
jgi:hypothetical protein